MFTTLRIFNYFQGILANRIKIYSMSCLYKFHMFYNFQISKKKMINSISPFIVKLQEIIKDSSNEQIIKFNESTARLEITSKKKLQGILPKYFRHGRFESFVRQLNWYGFYKINNKNTNAYSHPDLQKGIKLQSIKSRRKNINQKKLQQIIEEQAVKINDKKQNQEVCKISQNQFRFQSQMLQYFPVFQIGNQNTMLKSMGFPIIKPSSNTDIIYPFGNIQYFYV